MPILHLAVLSAQAALRPWRRTDVALMGTDDDRRGRAMRRHVAAPGLKRAVLAELCIIAMDLLSNVPVAVMSAPDSPPAK